ncbi:hypothetical protein TNCV_2378161 [Trichonephila clavipes]|nr:hypothetical protein TNCV_2378161 [Trichonephila clavipes]
MRISHKRLTTLEDNIRRVIADIRPQMLEKSHRKIGRPDWTTSELAVAVLCQKSYLKCNKEKPVNTVWQKLFVKPLMKMMEKRDLAVAVDGSWQKRGFSSKNGLVTVTEC